MIVFFQGIATAAAAGLLVWWLWRFLRREDSFTSGIVVAGFLLRAFAGLAAFWISYLSLPVLSHLQMGNGFWLHALDGILYLADADRAAHEGLAGILLMSRSVPSVAYVQTLACFVFLMGNLVSVALLLNLFCYLATATLLISCGKVGRSMTAGGFVSLLAVSLAPSWIVWSTQPLKDPLLIMLFVLFLYGALQWSEFWTRPEVSKGTLLLAIALMILSTFMLAGIRSYFAFLIWMASIGFASLTIWRTRRSRLVSAVVSVFLILFMADLIVWSADRFLSPFAREVLDFVDIGVFPGAPAVDSELFEEVERSRLEFEDKRGATEIHPGPSVPENRAGRLMAGAAALFLPRFLGRETGLVRIGGGQGLWLVAELDTIFFDAILAIAVAYLLLAWRRGRISDSVALLLVMIAAGIALPLAYVVTNFGTLFRLREMVFVSVALIPLFVSRAIELREELESRPR